MELVGTHQILCFLADLSVLRRQKLGAYRRVEDIQQHLAQHFFVLAACIRAVCDQMAHKGFGHADVYAVHRHMVAVIGCPAERKLRHIPGSDDQTIALVGEIHQHLRALPRLSVFVGYVMLFHILTDIPKMHLHRLADIDLNELCAECLRQPAGIFVGAVRRAKARHRHRYDIASAFSKKIKCPRRHKKGECRIQTTGHTDHRRLCAGMFVAFFQSMCLNR